VKVASLPAHTSPLGQAHWRALDNNRSARHAEGNLVQANAPHNRRRVRFAAAQKYGVELQKGRTVFSVSSAKNKTVPLKRREEPISTQC